MHETTEQLPVFFRLGISFVSFRLQYHSNALKKLSPFSSLLRHIYRSFQICYGYSKRKEKGDLPMTDKEYFCTQVHQYEKQMYTLAYGILKNPENAADAVQDAIVKAYTGFQSLHNRNQFRPWILRIVHNTAISQLRQQRDTEDIDSQWDLADSRHAVDHETRLTVWEAVQKLRLPYRLVIILYYYENCSVEQITKITATPAAAVRQQLSRGRKMLANLLNKEDFLV